MDSDSLQKTEENERQVMAETSADDLIDIDPAEFFDPEEFGIRRVSLRNLAGEDLEKHNTRTPSTKVEHYAEQPNR